MTDELDLLCVLRLGVEGMRRGAAALAAAAVLAASACDRPPTSDPATAVDADPSPSVRDSAGVTIVESGAPLWTEGTAWTVAPEPDLTIGGQGASPEAEFSRVADVKQLRDGRIVVAVGGVGEVRTFDPSGRHLSTVGRVGVGPGEFNPVAGMTICELADGSIMLPDQNLGRFTVFPPDGGDPRTIPFRNVSGGYVSPTACFADGGWLAGGGVGIEQEGRLQRRTRKTWAVSPQGEVSGPLFELETAAHWEEELRVGYLPIPFSPAPSLTAAADAFVLARGGPPEIEILDRRGRLTRIFRRTGVERPRSDDLYDEHVSMWMNGARGSELEPVLARFFERDLPMPERVPTYQDVIVDAEGHIWAEQFRLGSDRNGKRDVYRPDGRWLGTVPMPPGLVVHQLGRDFILGIMHDPLGVERVVRFPLIER